MPRRGPKNKPEGSSHPFLRGGPGGQRSGVPSPPSLVLPGPLPLPIYHHPVVALSLVLTVACLAQIAAWLVSTRLPVVAAQPLPSPALHGYLPGALQAGLETLATAERARSALFITDLGACLLSAAGWYAVARAGIGAEWGLWTALFWVVHPGFALVAQHAGPLALMILLTPVSLALMLWWRARRRQRAALLAGATLGLLALTGLQGLFVTPVAIAAMLLAPLRRATRTRGALFLCVGFGLVLAAAAVAGRPRFQLSEVTRHVAECWPLSLDSGSSKLGLAAYRELTARSTEPAPSCARFLLRQFRESPGESLHWLGERLWQSIYATTTRPLQRPLFAMQMLFIVPAAWGGIVALRHGPWRWTAMVCGLFVAVFWLLAGLMEPLARNLTPIGGIPILLALVGLADIYERLFGRRLTSDL